MSNSSLFLEAIINTEHKVYGKKLLPLSLFHIAMLENIKSPLLLGGEFTGEDIMKAAIVCSSKNVQKLNGKFRNFINNMLFFAYKPHIQLAKWQAYWDDYFPTPDFMDNEGEDKESKFPYVASCAARVIKNTGWSFNEVFYNIPVGQLVWLNLSFGFVESGETNIVSDKEKDIMQKIKMMEEAA
jgi:hypothetical protein